MRKMMILAAILSLSIAEACSLQRGLPNATADRIVSNIGDNSPASKGASAIPASYAIPAEAAVERKVIRNVEITLELADPSEGKARIEAIAESSNGFVVNSEVSTNDADRLRPAISIVLRIPALRFASVLDEIRGLGYRVRREKITGQDVTEEYVDLEARLNSKKAVEQQLLELVKQSREVADALEVEKALGQVRTEIEQLEGRRRFLDNQVTLSTFTVTLQTPASLISNPGFGDEFKRAVSEGFEGATAAFLIVLRLAIMIVPILVLIILPAVLFWRRHPRKAA